MSRWHLPTLFLSVSLGLSLVPSCQMVTGIGSAVPPLTVSSTAGGLKVLIEGDFAGLRSTQAAVSDVDKLTISIKPSSGAAQSQTLTKTQLAASPSATFSAIQPGGALVSLIAYDASSNAIGSTIGNATITAGQTATLSLSLKLDPTYVYATPAPTPSPGTLALTAHLSDGDTITGAATGTVLVNITRLSTGDLSFMPNRLSVKVGSYLRFRNYDQTSDSLSLVRTNSASQQAFRSVPSSTNPSYPTSYPYGFSEEYQQASGSFTYTVQNRTVTTALRVDVIN